MNKVRRLAEELVNKHPTLFSGDFDKNKLALSQVTVIRTRSIRNQLAGAITKLVHERGPLENPEESSAVLEEGETNHRPQELPTLEERAMAEGSQVPKLEGEQQPRKRDEELNSNDVSGSEAASDNERAISENKPITQ